MPWYVKIIYNFALKPLIISGLKSLELKYPGIKPIVDKVIELIESGVVASEIMTHLEACPGGNCQRDLARD